MNVLCKILMKLYCAMKMMIQVSEEEHSSKLGESFKH